MKKIYSALVLALFLMITPSSNASEDIYNFDEIKSYVVSEFGYDFTNKVNDLFPRGVDIEKVEKLKELLESKYLPKIENGEYSQALTNAILYIYIKTHDFVVDDSNLDIEDIKKQRNLVQKITHFDSQTNVYFFRQIDTWGEKGCGGIYTGSDMCYIYTEIDGELSYLGKYGPFLGGIYETTEISFLNETEIQFDIAGGDAGVGYTGDNTINIVTGNVNENRTTSTETPKGPTIDEESRTYTLQK